MIILTRCPRSFDNLSKLLLTRCPRGFDMVSQTLTTCPWNRVWQGVRVTQCLGPVLSFMAVIYLGVSDQHAPCLGVVRLSSNSPFSLHYFVRNVSHLLKKRKAVRSIVWCTFLPTLASELCWRLGKSVNLGSNWGKTRPMRFWKWYYSINISYRYG